MVILTDDDMAELPSTSSREIAVEKFVPARADRPDAVREVLLPRAGEVAAPSPTRLLRQALLDADRMAVVTVALRQRTTIAVLRVKDDVIVLQTMMWPDEVRTPDFSVETGEVKDAEVKMANMLVETLAGDFDASRVRGRLRRGRRGAGQDQDRGRRGQAHRRPRPSPPARSSTCWPRCSARSTPPRRPAARRPATPTTARTTADEEKPAKKAAAKKTAAKKAPAKKAAAKKATAKKTAAKKTTTKKTAAKKTAKKAS